MYIDFYEYIYMHCSLQMFRSLELKFVRISIHYKHDLS